MLITHKILAALAGVVALVGITYAAPAAVEKPKASAVTRLKPQLLSVEARRERQAAVDLNKVISTPVSADMAIDEQKAVTELAQKALGLRNAIQYRQELRERMAALHEALAENPNNAGLRAEMSELESKLDAASDNMSEMSLILQDAMQKQNQMFALMSNMSKMQHDTAKTVIENLRP